MSVYVVDCSLWIAALGWGGRPMEAIRHIVLDHELAISPAILAEVLEVLNRPKFSSFAQVAKDTLSILLQDALSVEPKEMIEECADPGDNIYLECAWEARAAALLTSDQHLLSRHPWRDIAIVTATEFLRVNNSSASQETVSPFTAPPSPPP